MCTTSNRKIILAVMVCILVSQVGVSAVFVVFNPGHPLAATPVVRAGLAPSSLKAVIVSFTRRRSSNILSPRELHHTVLLKNCCSTSSASPIICVLITYLSANFWVSNSASPLEVCESYIIGVVLPCPLRKPISSKKPPSLHSQF